MSTDTLDLKRIRKYSDYKTGSRHMGVDQQTSGDLQLNDVLAQYCTAETSIGQNLFFHHLYNPADDGTTYSRRIDRFNTLRSTGETYKLLSKIGFQKTGDLADELWHPTGYNLRKYRIYARIWMAVTLAALLGIPVIGMSMLLVNIPIWIINIVIHGKVRKSIDLHIGSISYLMRIVPLLPRIAGSLEDKNSAEARELLDLEKTVRSIRSFQRFLLSSSGSVAGDILSMLRDYIKIFLLVESFAFVSFYGKLILYQNELQRIYEIIGDIDCALVRDTITEGYRTCTPVFTDNRTLAGTKATHPLIDECVPNGFQFDGGVILTGTNMSGKSTFLRMVAINQIFAQSFGIAFAESWTSSFMRVFTSIESADNLSGNQSRYMAEAMRLRDAIHLIRSTGFRYLLTIDEILSGTNSEERIKAAIAILRSLDSSGSLVITATHDHEIARSLSQTYDNYHFTEIIDDTEMRFDYTLKPGIVDRRNAIRLLRHIGYPDDIMAELDSD